MGTNLFLLEALKSKTQNRIGSAISGCVGTDTRISWRREEGLMCVTWYLE